MVRFVVDGTAREAPEGAVLLDSLRSAGVAVPSLCYLPGLGPLQTCDACVVLVDGKLVRSCATAVREGLGVDTRAPLVHAQQEAALQRVLQNHELACTVCDKNNGDCELHATALAWGVRRQEFHPKPYPIDDSSPFYTYDPNQCILCGRCVAACQTLVVNEVLKVDWGRTPPRVVWDDGVDIDHSSCVSCGTCASVCPVDAMMEKSIRGRASHFSNLAPSTRRQVVEWTKEAAPDLGPLWVASEVEAASRAASIRRTKTVCTFCGVGCSFEVWTRGREILKVQPRPESPANGLATCVKGKFGYEFVNSPHRLTSPLVREGDQFVERSWDDAVARVADGLATVQRNYGPDAIGIIATCTGTNEEGYLTQKFARLVLGTHNVDNCARYCQAPATTGLLRTVGIGADPGTMADIEAADLVITLGSNTAESHPVLAGRVKRAHKLRGQKLVVLDPRRHDMAERADLHLAPRPGTDLLLLNAVAKYVLDHGWEDREFIAGRTTGVEAFRASVADCTVERAAAESGVPADQIVRFAELVHEARSVCALWAMGITQHHNGSDTSTAICNLLLLTGNFGRPATGGYPLRGHCNVQGVSDFGCLPSFLPGYQKVDDPDARARVEGEWGRPLPRTKGLTSTEMVDAILDGRIHALWILGEDKLLADADEAKVAEAFARLDFLAVNELFLTRTAECADVVLPAAASLEKDGTFVSTERRLQRLYRALPPPGAARTDGEIVTLVANALGAGWAPFDPARVLEEAARVAPAFAGARFDRLEGFASLLWPIAADGTDTPVLHRERFAFPDGRARFYPVPWTPGPAPPDEFDLSLDNGRLLEHFHWGNLTYEDPGIVRKVPSTFVEVSPELARERALREGDLVRLVSATGASRARVVVTDRVRGTTLFLSLHDRADAAVNRLTSDTRDPVSQTPDYKGVRVRLERVPTDGPLESPIPRTSPRGKRHFPQPGVNVEQKWARSDYRAPGG